ncbi:hypothetical protein [Microbulbifer sp. ALW1]|uniref:hypothetical protein n=1 Tax=Microbulbifer sp. (strain ALW1) TaxID=1516059 RepID=UPI001913744E|nr:hypothetical protein [Microbulbifer sp. ALW1]
MKVIVKWAAALMLIVSASAFAGDSLEKGQKLLPGERITSTNGNYYLIMQNDGNLVLYKKVGSGKEALWSSKTTGKPSARAVMQWDGNFVIYSTSSGALWSSNTHVNDPAKLRMQNDGNLVIYKTDGTPIWSTKTTQETCTYEYVDHWGGTVVDGTAQFGGYTCTVYAPLLPAPGPHFEPLGNGDLCVYYPPYAGKLLTEVCN